jgi:preprotein translocase subunit SecG
MKTADILQWVTLVSGVIIMGFVLLQSRGASLGAGFGASGELFTTRRGIDKSLHEATIVVAIIFVLSILVNLILA